MRNEWWSFDGKIQTFKHPAQNDPIPISQKKQDQTWKLFETRFSWSTNNHESRESVTERHKEHDQWCKWLIWLNRTHVKTTCVSLYWSTWHFSSVHGAGVFPLLRLIYYNLSYRHIVGSGWWCSTLRLLFFKKPPKPSWSIKYRSHGIHDHVASCAIFDFLFLLVI